MLHLAATAYLRMVGHCYDELPLEACGLLAGTPRADGTMEVSRCYPTENAAKSSRVYEVHGPDYVAADDDATAHGLELVGVFHSHTHTDPFPSPTDVANAHLPGWHHVIVSLRDDAPMTRSYRILGGKITEERVVVVA